MLELYMVKEIISDYINVVVKKTFVITVISSVFVRSVNARYEYVYLPFILAAVCVIIFFVI